MYRLATVWLVLLLAIPTPSMALENAGIVDGIWLSTPAPVEKQPVRIYVAIHNTTAGDLEGTVHFTVNDQLLDTMRLNALAGRIVEAWADWVPNAGTSTITVDLRRTELASTASGTQSVAVVQPLTERTIFIDYDTDGDTIGDQIDVDDDNDGVSDKTERADGTDPLVYDPPPVPTAIATTSTSSTSTSVASNAPAFSGSEPAGLEALIEPSVTQNALARSTDVITSSKEKLDTYRASRAKNTTGTTTTALSEKHLSTTVQAGAGGVYSALLAILSGFLSYPGLVQLLFLLLALYLLYRLTRHYGRRPN